MKWEEGQPRHQQLFQRAYPQRTSMTTQPIGGQYVRAEPWLS